MSFQKPERVKLINKKSRSKLESRFDSLLVYSGNAGISKDGLTPREGPYQQDSSIANNSSLSKIIDTTKPSFTLPVMKTRNHSSNLVHNYLSHRIAGSENENT